jgi:hypothetical protein
MQKRLYLTLHKNTSSPESVCTILTLESENSFANCHAIRMYKLRTLSVRRIKTARIWKSHFNSPRNQAFCTFLVSSPCSMQPILSSWTYVGNCHIIFGLYTLKKITNRDLELLFETLNKVHSCQRLYHVTRNAEQNCSVRQALVRQYYNTVSIKSKALP